MQSLGLTLIVVGLVIAGAGLLLYCAGLGPFSFLGRLPGDIRIENENVRFYFPLSTCLLISLVLTLLMLLISRFR